LERLSKRDAMKHLHLPLDQLPSRIKNLYLAFSGGIDSVVLLHNLLSSADDFSVVLWHINHGLQSNADEMEDFARQQANLHNLEIRVNHLSLVLGENNLEARARAKRYELFASAMSDQDALLTAHHMNDQAETLLLNIMRGSGSSGLSAIAMQRPLGHGTLFRPLLNASRSAIEEYAAQYQLKWVEDPSNASMQFDRNFTRHQVIPTLLDRWPAAVQQLHRVCEWQSESAEIADELAKLDYCQLSQQKTFTLYRCLPLEKLKTLSSARQKNLIRYWLKTLGKAPIGYKKMQTLLSQLNARSDSMPVIETGGYSIRLYQGYLYVVDRQEVLVLKSTYTLNDREICHIPQLGLKLSKKDLLEYLGIPDSGCQVSLHFRQSGVSDPSFSHPHKLKRLFQKHAVPPWLRDSTPQIRVDDELVGLWLF